MTTAETQTLSLPRPRRSWLVSTARRAGIDLLYLTAGMLTAIVAFTVWVVGFTISFSLAVFIVGLWVAIGFVHVFRWSCDLDRRLAALALGAPIERRYREVPEGSGWIDRLKIHFSDPQVGRDSLWLFVHSLLGFALGVAAIALVGTILVLVTIPTWWFTMPEGDYANVLALEVDSVGWSFAAMGLGLLLIPLAVWLLRMMARLESGLARALLSPLSRRELEEYVEHLSSTREDLVDTSRTDLERIERDLHDGAQARIVAMAMELGMAEEAIADDPEGAREMVARARAEALTALSELRDLARGMRPAVLAERGFAEAVEALAARSAIRSTTALRGDLDGLARGVETAAYYVVAEALTNANKHSDAGSARISIVRERRQLRLEIADDGTGGADASGSGLAGLRSRVAALDGELTVDSREGEGTAVRAVIPCG